MALEVDARNGGRAGTHEWVKHKIVLQSKQLDEPFWEPYRESSAMISIRTLRRQVEDVARVNPILPNPVRDFLAETA